MARSIVFLALASAVLALSTSIDGAPQNGVKTKSNTGTTCAACTVIVSLIEQLAQVHNNTIDKEVEKICDLFPDGPVRDGCDGVIMTFGPIVIELLAKKETPDVVCQAIKLCTGTCHLYPAPSIGVTAAGEAARSRLSPQHQSDIIKTATFLEDAMVSTSKANDDPLPPICNLPGLHDLCEIIFGFANDHLPLEDADHDGFSGHTEAFRGTNWRGKDCAPDDSQTYPGAKPVDDDRVKDSNCNGIYGVNPATGVPYEVEMCSGTQQFGIAVLGDSASAHFHVPPEFITAQSITDSTFKDILPILENEFDWPMLSATTAYFNSTGGTMHGDEDVLTNECSTRVVVFNRPFPNINGPVNSSYEIMRARNKCIHRDYQNIAVNGARSGAMNTTIQAGLSRVTGDHPLLLTYALIGNDVCNGHEDTVADMTTPAVMRANVLATMAYLDRRLPNGSHVVLMGLADGRILYESLHDRIHPLGQLRGDVTYAALYDYLNCLSISPCRGWMNSNATLRDATTQRAVELSEVLQEVVATGSYHSFDLHYIPNPIHYIAEKWNAKGGETWQLIEPVDGFHPNQLANSLVAEIIWDWFSNNATYDGLVPPVNPNNAMIEKVFGDQGGY